MIVCIAQSEPAAREVIACSCVLVNGGIAVTWMGDAVRGRISAVCALARWGIVPVRMLYLRCRCGRWGIPLMARVEGRRILRVTWFMGIVVAMMEFVGTIVEMDGKF